MIALAAFDSAFMLRKDDVKPDAQEIEVANNAVLDMSNLKNISQVFSKDSALNPSFKPLIVALCSQQDHLASSSLMPGYTNASQTLRSLVCSR